MKVAKRILSPLEKVYAVSGITIEGTLHLLAATEEHGRCLLFSPPDWTPSIVWDGPGGTMNLIPLPDTSGRFLAIQGFFPIFQSDDAGIVHAAYDRAERQWRVDRILDLPFVHRIDVVKARNAIFLVAGTLCSGKTFRDDWSQPGAVYAGKIPGKPSGPWRMEPVLKGISKNHGLHVAVMDGRQCLLVAGQEGLFSIQVPDQGESAWETRRLISHEISDVVTFDLNGDGKPEIITIEPFHGDVLAVYGNENGRWNKIYEASIHFGHALWAGRLGNEVGILVGNRGGQKELLWFRVTSTRPVQTERIVLDQDIGPAQVTVVSEKQHDWILSANHGAGEVGLYTLG
jgi:hypothetical protein